MSIGSSSIDNCTNNDTVGEQLYEESRSKRPDFYPCEECGSKFTMLAMAVHKRSCLETEDCPCYVCKSRVKKFKWNNTEGKNEAKRDLYCNLASRKNKISARVKPSILPLLTDKSFPMKNGVIAEKNLISFKLVENDIIDKMVRYDNSAESEDSALKYSDSATFNDHKCISMPPEMLENSNTVNNKPQGSPDQFSVFLKLNDKVDHECTRKIFCLVCNEHIYWKIFGLHLIEHCAILDNNDLKCPGCDKVFNKPARILTHFIVHISSHPECCDVSYCSDSKCIEARNRASDKHADSSLYYCYICLNRFSPNQSVVNHMRLHTNAMPFTECN